jgi:DNA-directed RNA polymerase subunit RPC12/RpoP
MSSMPSQSPSIEPTTEGPRQPPPGRKFPCAKCGARLDFDPSAHGLRCPYCGHFEKIEPTAREVVERDWDEFWTHHEKEEDRIAGRSSQVTCSVCGAIVLVEDKVQTDKCPYCGTFLENKPESAKGMIQPSGVLAFAITDREAREAFNRWVAGRWFAPSQFRKLADLGKLSNCYVPHWTYDSMTYTHYTGERGDDYTETEYYTETDANGNMVQRSRQVTKTRWTPVSGMVRHFFDDVLICASRSVSEHLVRGLAPWDLPKLEDFRAELLSGFQTERYAVGLREGFEKAKRIMDAEIRRLCTRDIGGNHQRLYTVSTQHVGVTFKHILLPVWLAPYRYQQQTYQILVNGRTGKVNGTRPYSWIKIALFVLVILAVLGIGLFLVSRTRGAQPARRAEAALMQSSPPRPAHRSQTPVWERSVRNSVSSQRAATKQSFEEERSQTGVWERGGMECVVWPSAGAWRLNMAA